MKIKIGKLSVSNLGVFLFLLAMYSIGTISAITVSWTLTLALLVFAVGLFFLNYYLHRGRYFNSLIAVWIVLTLLCFIGVVRGDSITTSVFYVLCLFILLLCEKISIKSLFDGLKWIKYSGIFFARGET